MGAMRIAPYMIACALLGAISVGCSSPPPQPDKREQALKDPMNYNPAAGDETIGGHQGVFGFDKKAFNRDVNDVLDP